MKKHKKAIKKFMKSYYEFEHLIDLTGGFILILAFVIALPSLIELQMGFITALVLLAIALKITMLRLRLVFPELSEESKQEYIFDKRIDYLKDEIKSVERRLKKIEKEKQNKNNI